jgi:hypothetical protein
LFAGRVRSKEVVMRISVLTLLILGATIAPAGFDEVPVVEVDCDEGQDLQEAIDTIAQKGGGDVLLRGICKGNFQIGSDDITLRGLGEGPGIVALRDNRPALEIEDASAVLRGITIEGGAAGVEIRGARADVLLVGVEVFGQAGSAVFIDDRARVRLFECSLHDAGTGVFARGNSDVNFDRSIASNLHFAIVVSDRGRAVISGARIEQNQNFGVDLNLVSSAVIQSTVFSENGRAHIRASDRSGINFFDSPYDIGSAEDETRYAIELGRSSRADLFTGQTVHGNILVSGSSSLQMGFADLLGNLEINRFSDAWILSSTIAGTVDCRDGGDAFCRGTSTEGSVGCPSPSCAGVASAAPFRPLPEMPEYDLKRIRENP